MHVHVHVHEIEETAVVHITYIYIGDMHDGIGNVALPTVYILITS